MQKIADQLSERYVGWPTRLRFNSSFRDECLNETLFSSSTQAQKDITAWKKDYNRTDHTLHLVISHSEFA